MIIAVSSASTSTLLSRLAKKMARSAQEEELGIRPRQFWVLSFLSEHDGVPQHELGDAFMLDANNAVLLLNELEAAGYIERRRNPQDRRRHLVFLTDAGHEALKSSRDAYAAKEDAVLGRLSSRERDTLRALLTKALEG
jgi:DNA-binding MarR family transcriptional regulator